MMIEIKAQYPTDDEIFIPKRQKLPKADIPAVELTERQAAELGWAFRKKSKSVRITNYHGSGSWLVIPSRIGGLPVNEIGKDAFAVKDISNAPLIEQVMIPNSVRKIGEGAFSRSEVMSVVFGDGVRDIPKESFFLCKRLEFVRLPAGLMSIGESAFRLCKNLRYIILPESLRTIGTEAFFSSGLESFASNNRFCLDDARAFALTPMHKKYKLVLRRDSVTSMDVFMVGVGAEVKFPHTCVRLGKNAASAMCSLNFSECTNVFSDNAFPDKRNSYGSKFFSIDIKALVPPGIKHLYFPEYVDVWYTDGRPYTGMFEITDDPVRTGSSITLKPNSKTLPSWSVEMNAEEIKIVHDHHLKLTIDECAFNTRKLKRLEMHNVSLLGRIFSPFCRALREVSWSDRYGAFTQYIPPVELIGEILHEELIRAFGNRDDKKDHYLFNRNLWDRIFTAGRVEYPVLPAFMRRTDIKELSQRDRILIAIDVLRSTGGQRKAAPEIYTEYLRTHLRYAKIVCKKIKDKYPEYGEYLGTIF